MRTAILDLVYVGLGGFLGSIGRYLASGAVHQIFPNIYFPIGTAAVNIIGCFLIGVLTGIFEVRNDITRRGAATPNFHWGKR
jgi:CrcB protein